ncbi:MAG TPA: branched-chain amino acid ABC transporter substrate-binding protein [Gemmata sp.]|nr:branched-chain amino acid ABC transporter substrate-binding protein [Gemmata sp.]
MDRQDADKANAQNGNAQPENQTNRTVDLDRRKFLRGAAGTAGLVAVGGLVLGYGGCSSKGNTLKIVSSLPRTGSAQGQTNTIVNGIKMAIEDYGGEIAGMKLAYQDMDDATAAQGQWDAGKEADNAREAISDGNVMVFIGPYNSGAAKVSMPLLSEAGLLQISPAATWPGLTKKVAGDEKSGEPDIYRKSDKITFCRVCPTDDIQGPLSAVFAKETLGVKKVYIFDDKELYGAGIAGLFKKKCQELGVEILGHESIVASQKSFKTLIQSIKGKNPQLVYFGGTTQSGGPQIAIDMKGEGLNCPLMVPDGCYEKEFIKGAGADLLNGWVYATIGGKDPSQLTGAGAEFVKKYKAKFKDDDGKELEPEAYAAYGYEAAKVFLEAVKKVGKKDREELRKAVLETKDFTAGILGKWSFTPEGDTTSQVLTISKIEDGRFKPVKTQGE